MNQAEGELSGVAMRDCK